jgi:hypothetical protein
VTDIVGGSVRCLCFVAFDVMESLCLAWAGMENGICTDMQSTFSNVGAAPGTGTGSRVRAAGRHQNLAAPPSVFFTFLLLMS